MPLGTEIGLSLGDCVRWGFICPFPKGAHPPIFGNARCGQTVVGLRCYLLMNGMEVGLSPGNFVFDGDPAPPEKKDTAPTQFLPRAFLWPKGWMYQDATWDGSKPVPRRRCVRWGRRTP